MASFDTSFDSSFDAGAVSNTGVASLGLGIVVAPTDAPSISLQIATGRFYQTSMPLSVNVVSPHVFSTAEGYLRWFATVKINGDDISGRLAGQLRISADEDSARVASFSFVPTTADSLSAYESGDVTIDYTLIRAGQTATYRRFTGVVEALEFLPADRLVTINCRDGYQERPLACSSPDAVRALFSGLESPCEKLVGWSVDSPDPQAYFSGLLDTVPGCCFINGDGIWKTRRWNMDGDTEYLSESHVFEGSLKVVRGRRADLPSSIRATLNHRLYRLNCVEVDLNWTMFPIEQTLIRGMTRPTVALATEAISGLSGWYVRGEPVFVHPLAMSYPVLVNGISTYYIISPDAAPLLFNSMDAKLYHRWYSEVQVSYSVDIEMGGNNTRDESITETIQSTFDASAWESAPSGETTSRLYTKNPPPIVAVKTGFEGLPTPHPPANGVFYHTADISDVQIYEAIRHLVARALRSAAQGKRAQTVEFSKVIDPRFDIGSVISISAFGVSAIGQVKSFTDTLDHDSGDAMSTFVLACPDGSGSITSVSSSALINYPDVSYVLPSPHLDTFCGADNDTLAAPPDDSLNGWLTNTVPTSEMYSASKPVYQEQFRVIMPEIPADWRNPSSISIPVTADVHISGSGISIDF